MKRKMMFGAVLLALLLGIGGILLFRQTSWADLYSVLRRADPRFLLCGLLLMLGFVGAEALGSQGILRALGTPAPLRRCMSYSMLGFCCSSITPSSSGGQPAQIWAMKRDGIPMSHGSLVMLLLAVCYQTAMLLSGAVGCLLLGGIPGWGHLTGWLLLLGFSINLILTLGMLAVLLLPGPARILVMGSISLAQRMGLVSADSSLPAKALAGLEQYAVGSRCIRRHPGLALRTFACTGLQLLFLNLVPWMVFLGLGIHAAPLQVIATQSVLTLSVAAFPLPGSTGAAEGAFLALFAPILGGISAAPVMLLSRGISFYLFLPLCCGLCFWGLYRRSSRPIHTVLPSSAAKAA